MTTANIMQATFDALNAIGRCATQGEILARLPYRSTSVTQALKKLRDHGLIVKTGCRNDAKWCLKSGSQRPIDGRGHRSKTIRHG